MPELYERLAHDPDVSIHLREVEEAGERIRECRERRQQIEGEIRDLQTELENLDSAESELRSRIESHTRDAMEEFSELVNEYVREQVGE